MNKKLAQKNENASDPLVQVIVRNETITADLVITSFTSVILILSIITAFLVVGKQLSTEDVDLYIASTADNRLLPLPSLSEKIYEDQDATQFAADAMSEVLTIPVQRWKSHFSTSLSERFTKLGKKMFLKEWVNSGNHSDIISRGINTSLELVKAPYVAAYDRNRTHQRYNWIVKLEGRFVYHVPDGKDYFDHISMDVEVVQESKLEKLEGLAVHTVVTHFNERDKY